MAGGKSPPDDSWTSHRKTTWTPTSDEPPYGLAHNILQEPRVCIKDPPCTLQGDTSVLRCLLDFLGLSPSSSSHFLKGLASKGFPGGIRNVCVCPPALGNSEPAMLISRARPDEHPPTPPPCRWPALITLPTLAKFQLV